MAHKRLLSIIICSKDRFDSLRNLIEHLRGITHNSFEIEIVVVEEIEIPSPIDGTIYYHLPVKGLGFGYARQRATQVAHGSLFVFLDDDCIPSKEWLYQLLVPFESEHVSAVGGGILPNASGPIGFGIALLGFPAGGLPRLLQGKANIHKSRHLSTGNLALRRKSVEEAGGFSTFHRYGGEDQELIRALRGHTLFNPFALVYHKQRESIKDVWFWFSRRGKGEYFINRQHKLGRFHSLFRPWRWSWWWRILSLIIFIFFFGTIPLLGIVFCYYLYLLLRTFLMNRSKSLIPEVEACRRESLKLSTLFWVPIIRFAMDFGREWGRMQAVLKDIFYGKQID